MRSIYRENNGLLLIGSADDLDDPSDSVPFSANHLEPRDRRRQPRLEVVLTKLAAALGKRG